MYSTRSDIEEATVQELYLAILDYNLEDREHHKAFENIQDRWGEFFDYKYRADLAVALLDAAASELEWDLAEKILSEYEGVCYQQCS